MITGTIDAPFLAPKVRADSSKGPMVGITIWTRLVDSGFNGFLSVSEQVLAVG